MTPIRLLVLALAASCLASAASAGDAGDAAMRCGLRLGDTFELDKSFGERKAEAEKKQAAAPRFMDSYHPHEFTRNANTTRSARRERTPQEFTLAMVVCSW
ncbi:hypothetical protein E4634_01340 [Mangrovimicrobium sediminis]|uniref:Secreted protein n=1 Tax=Mangrovimicrobium sediminis TaxID=2562682 RepID=A0A4Z0M9Z7_9GAMM|nr:hypothetical protein [Haliea sp. SAOS-164]TGD76217.1 hypothetical protein E4634_01340 [Haliea sp. SAOS-164]